MTTQTVDDRQEAIETAKELIALMSKKLSHQEPVWGDSLLQIALKLDFIREVLED